MFDSASFFRLSIFVPMLSFVLLGCGLDVEDVASPQPLLKFCKKAGFVPLIIPDTDYKAGSVISLKDDEVSYVGHMKTCGYPNDVLKPLEGSSGQISLINDSKFTLGVGVDVGVNALVNIDGIEAGAEYGRVKKTKLESEDYGVDKLEFLSIKKWERKNYTQSVDPVCKAVFQKPNVYVISEAFRVREAAYSIFDENGAKLNVDVGNVQKFLDIKSRANVKIGGNGKILIKKPTTLCVRNVIWYGNSVEGVGLGAEESILADGEIERLYAQ